MKKVKYDDMIGAPFERHAFGPDRFDCIGVVREVYRRAGWSSAALPTADNEEVCAAACAVDDADVVGSEWERVDTVNDGAVAGTLDFGDVIVLVLEASTHVSVVVDAPSQLALSAAEALGVYACPIPRLRCITGVYRLREGSR
jgi:hypothetical protein